MYIYYFQTILAFIVQEFRYFAGSSVPSSGGFMSHAQAVPIPIRPAEIQRSLSWQNHSNFSSSVSYLPYTAKLACTGMNTITRIQSNFSTVESC